MSNLWKHSVCYREFERMFVYLLDIANLGGYQGKNRRYMSRGVFYCHQF